VGRIGFLFNVLSLDSSDFFVVFLEDERIERYVIIGDCFSFREDDCNFYFLRDDFELERFLVFEGSLFKYAKVSLAKRKCVDFEFLTFWFEPSDYKFLRENLIIEGDIDWAVLEDELKLRAFRLFKFFEKSF
jgi:hypothetical protein